MYIVLCYHGNHLVWLHINFAYTPQLLNHNQSFIQEYFKRGED